MGINTIPAVALLLLFRVIYVSRKRCKNGSQNGGKGKVVGAEEKGGRLFCCMDTSMKLLRETALKSHLFFTPSLQIYTKTLIRIKHFSPRLISTLYRE